MENNNEILTIDEMLEKYLKETFDININDYPENVQKGLKDIERNHNRNWTLDVYKKNENNLDKKALIYRGTVITYRELFKTVEVYASIFKKMGINSASEIPMCMANCPEFVYTIMAINLLGAKINCFGEFNSEYLTEIINDCDAPFVICTDDKYEAIKDSIDNSKINDVLMFSLTDSLKNGKDPYIELDREFYDFENRTKKYKEKNSNIIDINDFLSNVDYDTIKTISEYPIGSINDVFLVTYSSGSTNANRPKAIIHTNRSLITMGRFQDQDLSDLPKTEDLVGEALIPTHSNTDIITSISDVLYKSCAVALEPIYNREFFLTSLAINKPNYVSAPRNMIITAMKQLHSDKRFENLKLSQMMLLTSVGEPTSIGEEKFINKMLKKAQCGVDKLPKPFSPVPVSIGGGNCECGGLFFTPYRKYQDLHPKYSLTKGRIGLKKYHMVQMAILDENNKFITDGRAGRLVVKTPTMMKKYKNNDEATKDFYIEASDGSVWADFKCYAAIEKYGSLTIHGRMGNELILDNDQKFPLFLIGQEVEKDTKHILSYEVVNVDNKIIIHVEFQPDRKNNVEKILIGIENRIIKQYGQNIADKVVYRVRSFEEGFVGTACEKRDYNALVKEGINKKCIKPILENGQIELISADDYFNEKHKVLSKHL